jgi:hypothetical protein
LVARQAKTLNKTIGSKLMFFGKLELTGVKRTVLLGLS